MVRLTTPRLLLRRLDDDDLAAMTAINTDPEVMRWRSAGISDQRATAAGIAASRQHWDEHGFGMFAVEVRASGELAGITGLSTPQYLPEVLPAVQIGWRLARHYWGHGIATEAARAVLHFGFTDHRLDRIISICRTGNDASEHIMQKLGMHLDRDTSRPDGRPVRVYAIDRDEYAHAGSRTEAPR